MAGATSRPGGDRDAARIDGAMPEKLLGGAAAVVAVATGVVRHLAWYVSYRVSGEARDGGFSRSGGGSSKS